MATESQAENLARRFHETYERLAPDFRYETRKESAKPWADVPEKNKRLMIAVCAALLPEIEREAFSAGFQRGLAEGSGALDANAPTDAEVEQIIRENPGD